MKKDEGTTYNLYFIIRSVITSSIGFVSFAFVALMLGHLSGIQAIALSILCFAYPVLLTNLLHRRIQRVVEKTLLYLVNHERVEKFVIRVLR
jgi:uncharacterized membrane protein